MTRRGLTLAFAISLSTVTGAGVAHADPCPSGTYRIDGVFGGVPYVRMGGSRTVDNVMHLDAPDQTGSRFEVMVAFVHPQKDYTPGPPPSVQMSLDGGPTHSFSFSWHAPDGNGNLGTWNSDQIEFGALTRGTHTLHTTLSVPAGNPEGIYELSPMAHMEGPCFMVSVTEAAGFSVWFTNGNPAQPSTPAAGGGTSHKPSPRPTPTATDTPTPSPTADTPSPSPSPSASPTPSPSPTPTDSPTASPSPTAVPLAATPTAHGSSALPWLLGAPAALAALLAGGVLALRRRRVTADAGEPEPEGDS